MAESLPVPSQAPQPVQLPHQPLRLSDSGVEFGDLAHAARVASALRWALVTIHGDLGAERQDTASGRRG